ncbi:MAG: alanine racemase [Deinococcales bacterium]
MQISELDTPAPVIDLDKVEANIKALQNYADSHNIVLRPHIKTHKLPLLAHKQLATGAKGITCQKISEAMVMAESGIQDILLSYNIVGKQKIKPLTNLACLSDLKVGLDNEVALATVAEAATLADKRIGVVLEFESGNERQGLREVSSCLALAQKVQSHAKLYFAGLMTYPLGQYTDAWLNEAKSAFC